jgi:hypothetical protein
VRAHIRKRLAVSARAFSMNGRNRTLRRAQLSFGAAWTAEWALTVVLAVVAYRHGGAQAAGIVAFVRADRFPRDRVLVWSHGRGRRGAGPPPRANFGRLRKHQSRCGLSANSNSRPSA